MTPKYQPRSTSLEELAANSIGPNAQLNLPVYLDADVQAYLAAIAAKKGVPLSELTNELLKNEIAILEAVK